MNPMSISLLLLLVGAEPAQECGEELFVAPLGEGTVGTGGVPRLRNGGLPLLESPYHAEIDSAVPNSSGLVVVGLDEAPVFLPPFGGTFFVASPFALQQVFLTDADGRAPDLLAMSQIDPGLCGLRLVVQAFVLDAGAQGGFSMTNALSLRVGTLVKPLFDRFNYPTEGWAHRSLTTGDLDNDGDQDMIAAHSEGVTVFLNAGAGSFSQSALINDCYPLQSWGGADFVRLAYLDEDQILDLLVLCKLGGAFTYLGNGDGTFSPASPLVHQGACEGAGTGDVNNDGFTDIGLAVINLSTPASSAGDINVFLGSAGGVFGDPIIQKAGATTTRVEFADLNDDSIEDMVFSRFSKNEVAVMRGIGDGTFDHLRVYSLPSFPLDLQLEDWTGDGLVDVIVSTSQGDVLAFASLGDATLGPPRQIAEGEQFAFSDVNGDSLLDLVVGGVSVDVSTQLGAEGGGFLPPQLVTQNEAEDLALADMNGDGLADILLGKRLNTDTNISVYLSDGTGVYPDAAEFDGGGFAHPWSFRSGDFDGDGFDDLLGWGHISPEHTMRLWKADGDGGFLDPTTLISSAPSDVEMADLDGNGTLDLVFVDNGEVSLLMGVGDGTFEAQLQVPTPDHHFSSVEAGRVDGDEHLDLVASWSAGLVVLVGHGDGTFGDPIQTVIPASRIELAQLNSDDFLDLIVESMGVRGLLGNGDGTYTFGPEVDVASPESIAVGDYDGDGWDDVAMSYVDDSPKLQVLPSQGDGGFGPPLSLNFPTPAFVANGLFARDMDDDGSLDLVFRAGFPGILRGHGDGSFGYPVGIGDLKSSAVTVGDFDGDGALDLVSKSGSTIQLFLNRALE